jgi:hypothetical protein
VKSLHSSLLSNSILSVLVLQLSWFTSVVEDNVRPMWHISQSSAVPVFLFCVSSDLRIQWVFDVLFYLAYFGCIFYLRLGCLLQEFSFFVTMLTCFFFFCCYPFVFSGRIEWIKDCSAMMLLPVKPW